MRVNDWLPVSAASLVTGAMALLLASALTQNGDDPGATLMIVEEASGRWLGGALMFFLASVGLVLGLPSIIVLVRGPGRRTAMAACAVLAVGYVGTAGYAALLVFLRSLVVTDSVDAASLTDVSEEAGLLTFVAIWVGAFYIGELLLAAALLRAGPEVIGPWVPALLLLHVVVALVSTAAPDWVGRVTVVLAALPLCAIGIRVTQR
ncbi:hypothetical protein [Nocardioides ginkgobilobae]